MLDHRIHIKAAGANAGVDDFQQPLPAVPVELGSFWATEIDGRATSTKPEETQEILRGIRFFVIRWNEEIARYSPGQLIVKDSLGVSWKCKDLDFQSQKRGRRRFLRLECERSAGIKK